MNNCFPDLHANWRIYHLTRENYINAGGVHSSIINLLTLYKNSDVFGPIARRAGALTHHE